MTKSTATPKGNLLSTRKEQHLLLDPENLVEQEGFNVRQDYGDIEALAASILENGVRIPLSGFQRKDGKFVVVDGHRRRRAIKLLIERGAEKFRVPFIVEENVTEEQRLTDMFTKNQGKELNPIEQAELVLRFEKKNFTQREIAQKLGVSIAQVSNLLKLAKSPISLKSKIINNEVSSTLVLSMLRENKKKEMTKDEITKEVDITLGKLAKTATANRITLRHVRKTENKYPSVSIARKIIKKNTLKEVKKHEEEYEFIRGVLNGRISETAFLKRYGLDKAA